MGLAGLKPVKVALPTVGHKQYQTCPAERPLLHLCHQGLMQECSSSFAMLTKGQCNTKQVLLPLGQNEGIITRNPNTAPRDPSTIHDIALTWATWL